MENSTEQRDQLIEQLHAQHQALKARIRELDKHISLTSAEQVEYARLKKKKLLTKDQLRLLRNN